jgi:uncharacterized damage-inducible protein DinB
MHIRDYAVAMAAYNRWMNQKVYACAAALSDEERKRDLGAFFKSVHGTLNHLLLGDQAWMQRLHGQPVTLKTSADELYADFDALREARVRMDDELERWAGGLTDEFAATPYRFFSVILQRQHSIPGWATVVQVFNHQTHHRGQLTTLLKQLGQDPGVTDFPWMPAFFTP